MEISITAEEEGRKDARGAAAAGPAALPGASSSLAFSHNRLSILCTCFVNHRSSLWNASAASVLFPPTDFVFIYFGSRRKKAPCSKSR